MSLYGEFTPPGDKSISHRLALFSLLAKGETTIDNMSPCADVRSSLEAVRKIGVDWFEQGDKLILKGQGGAGADKADIDCGNSGTTMRLLMGILAGRSGEFTLDGDESLRRRPMERNASPLREMGADVATSEGLCPVTIRGGGLKGIEYRLPAASAQLKSAVLLAGLQAEGRTMVQEPVPSRDHTERMIELFGGKFSKKGEMLEVAGSELNFVPNFRVPGDASSASFFLCAAAIMPGSKVTAKGMLLNKTRIGFIDVLKRMGARLEIETMGEQPEPWGNVTVSYSPDLKATEIEAWEIPLLVDEVPILALTAALAEGRTVFHDVGELRIKESDRLAAVAGQLGLMGVDISIDEDRLIVQGPSTLTAPDELDSFGDHRMAMMLRLAVLMTGEDCPIKREESAGVSYPDFQRDLQELIRN